MEDDTNSKQAWDNDAYREFERKMRLIEEGPTTTNFEQLLTRGVELPEPDSIPDHQINAKLWEVINALAAIRVFLECTDHLSDRELYSILWHRALRHEVAAIDEIGFNAHLDLCLAGDDDWSQVHLRYYADEEERARWKQDFPDDVIPPHEEPPFDRDRLMPDPYPEREEPGR
jgi:hypothetical protein